MRIGWCRPSRATRTIDREIHSRTDPPHPDVRVGPGVAHARLAEERGLVVSQRPLALGESHHRRVRIGPEVRVELLA